MRTVIFGLSALSRNVNLMVSSMLPCVITWLQEKCSPYACKINNMMETLSLLNLNIILIVLLDSTSNQAVVNISVSVTMLQLTYIVFVHVKDLLCSTVFKNTHFSLNIINKLRHRVDTDQSHTLELINPIPEVAYNFKVKSLLLDMINRMAY